jgi:hypothetical protein
VAAATFISRGAFVRIYSTSDSKFCITVIRGGRVGSRPAARYAEAEHLSRPSHA